jgi:hypothetical protein
LSEVVVSPSPKTQVHDNSAEQATILLLDAENMDLPEEAEGWLNDHCRYPITLRFAFANWKKLGDLDKWLHQRGYHLFHVPDGKNNADSKMIVVGASIRRVSARKTPGNCAVAMVPDLRQGQ